MSREQFFKHLNNRDIAHALRVLKDAVPGTKREILNYRNKKYGFSYGPSLALEGVIKYGKVEQIKELYNSYPTEKAKHKALKHGNNDIPKAASESRSIDVIEHVCNLYPTEKARVKAKITSLKHNNHKLLHDSVRANCSDTNVWLEKVKRVIELYPTQKSRNNGITTSTEKHVRPAIMTALLYREEIFDYLWSVLDRPCQEALLKDGKILYHAQEAPPILLKKVLTLYEGQNIGRDEYFLKHVTLISFTREPEVSQYVEKLYEERFSRPDIKLMLESYCNENSSIKLLQSFSSNLTFQNLDDNQIIKELSRLKQVSNLFKKYEINLPSKSHFVKHKEPTATGTRSITAYSITAYSVGTRCRLSVEIGKAISKRGKVISKRAPDFIGQPKSANILVGLLDLYHATEQRQNILKGIKLDLNLLGKDAQDFIQYNMAYFDLRDQAKKHLGTKQLKLLKAIFEGKPLESTLLPQQLLPQQEKHADDEVKEHKHEEKQPIIKAAKKLKELPVKEKIEILMRLGFESKLEFPAKDNMTATLAPYNKQYSNQIADSITNLAKPVIDNKAFEPYGNDLVQKLFNETVEFTPAAKLVITKTFLGKSYEDDKSLTEEQKHSIIEFENAHMGLGMFEEKYFAEARLSVKKEELLGKEINLAHSKGNTELEEALRKQITKSRNKFSAHRIENPIEESKEENNDNISLDEEIKHPNDGSSVIKKVLESKKEESAVGNLMREQKENPPKIQRL